MTPELKKLLIDADSVLTYLWYRGGIDRHNLYENNIDLYVDVQDLLTRIRDVTEEFYKQDLSEG